VTNALHHKLNANVMEGEQQVMSAYEQAFRKIKEATGVGDVNEVIQKFLTQEQTQDNLVTMTKEAQARIEQLAEERLSTKTMVDEMKYSGGGGQSSRQEVEQWERKLSDAQNALERVKLRHTRMTKVFIDVRAGIEHMADKLETVKLEVPSVPISDETIVDVMLQCDSKLMKMYDVVGTLPDDDAADRDLLGGGGDRDGPSSDSQGYNVRVALSNDEYDEGDDDDDDDLDGMEADIPDRQQMKKMHGAMLDKATAKNKRKKKGKFGAESAAGVKAASAKGGPVGKGGASTGGRKLDTD